MHSDGSAAAPSHDVSSHHSAVDHHQHDSFGSHHHHHHDSQHNHHHHHNGDHRHHHHHHRHGTDDNNEPPVEVLTTPLLWQQRQNQAPVCDCNRRPSTPMSVLQMLVVLVWLGFIGFIAWNVYSGWNNYPRPGPFSTFHIATAAEHERAPKSIKARVHGILATTPLIDGHDDFAIFLRSYFQNNIASPDFDSGFRNGSLPENVDLARLRSGQVGGAFWSAYVGCPLNASFDMSDANYARATSATLEQIDVLRRLQAQYPTDFTPAVSTPTDPSGREKMLLQWHATRSFFGPISIEGLHQIPPSSPLSTLRLYHALGVRMATLTWNCHNPFADASLLFNGWGSPPTVVNGISRPNEGAVTLRGRQVLREMNRLGMIIDLSHTSYWTQKAVLSADENGDRLSRAPVVFSHSSAYSICPHPRNVRDDILEMVPRSNSLVMVNFSPDFISCTTSSSASVLDDPHFSLPTTVDKNSTLHQVARHIVYIANRIGYDHVGIGSDFDGIGSNLPRGLEGVDKFPDLIAELLRMGVTDDEAKKVVGGNLLRVWKKVDDVAANMIKEGVEPGVDDVR